MVSRAVPRLSVASQLLLGLFFLLGGKERKARRETNRKRRKAHPDSVKVFDARVLLGAIVGAHMDAIIQLLEALLPRIVGVTVVRCRELKLARRGVHQRSVVLKDRLVEAFPVGFFSH